MSDFNSLYPDQPPEEEEGLFKSVALAPLRGVAGAAAGVANLFGADVQDNFGLGHSKSVAGGLLEGLSQFLTGFIPVAGWVGRGGSILSKTAQGAAKAAGATKKAAFIAAGRGAAAGAVADFAVFDGNDPRLSNLIQDFPMLQNPITEFLAADENDGEVFGRLKNVIEGLGLGVAAEGVSAMIGKIKTRNKLAATGDTKGVAKVDEELASLAKEVHDSPRDLTDIEREKVGAEEPREPWEETDLLGSEDALDPEAPKPDRQEVGRKLREATEDPKATEDTQGPAKSTEGDPEAPKPENIPFTEIKRKLAPDPNEGPIVVINANDPTVPSRASANLIGWSVSRAARWLSSSSRRIPGSLARQT